MIYEHQLGTLESATEAVVDFIAHFRDTFYDSRSGFNANVMYNGMTCILSSDTTYDSWALRSASYPNVKRRFDYFVDFLKSRDINVMYRSSWIRNRPISVNSVINPLFFDFPCEYRTTISNSAQIIKRLSYTTVDGEPHKWFIDREISRPTAEEWLMFTMETGIEI